MRLPLWSGFAAFGWITGQLSAVDRALPFVLNMGLFVVVAGLVWLISRRQGHDGPLEPEKA